MTDHDRLHPQSNPPDRPSWSLTTCSSASRLLPSVDRQTSRCDPLAALTPTALVSTASSSLVVIVSAEFGWCSTWLSRNSRRCTGTDSPAPGRGPCRPCRRGLLRARTSSPAGLPSPAVPSPGWYYASAATQSLGRVTHRPYLASCVNLASTHTNSGRLRQAANQAV
jgi:hypothetical protein